MQRAILSAAVLPGIFGFAVEAAIAQSSSTYQECLNIAAAERRANIAAGMPVSQADAIWANAVAACDRAYGRASVPSQSLLAVNVEDPDGQDGTPTPVYPGLPPAPSPSPSPAPKLANKGFLLGQVKVCTLTPNGDYDCKDGTNPLPPGTVIKGETSTVLTARRCQGDPHKDPGCIITSDPDLVARVIQGEPNPTTVDPRRAASPTTCKHNPEQPHCIDRGVVNIYSKLFSLVSPWRPFDPSRRFAFEPVGPGEPQGGTKSGASYLTV